MIGQQIVIRKDVYTVERRERVFHADDSEYVATAKRGKRAVVRVRDGQVTTTTVL